MLDGHSAEVQLAARCYFPLYLLSSTDKKGGDDRNQKTN
jgi:hypothetical protein